MATVRKFSMCGPCLTQGELISESAKFYTFADRYRNGGKPKKIAKTNAHIEPCTRCTDHPETSYPNGYMD